MPGHIIGPTYRFPRRGFLAGLAASIALMLAVSACSPVATPAQPPTPTPWGIPTSNPTNPADDLASLKATVAAQGTRIAVLETKVASSAPVQPTPTPTPTIVPAVAGLTVDGATKGVATAKVTIIEYVDYL